MKKIIISVVLIITLFGMVGCTRGSGVMLMGTEKNSNNKMSMSYYRFTGYRETDLQVDEGKEVVISVNIVTEKGTIDASIKDENDNYAYEGHEIPTSDFSVTLSEPGDYTIKVETKKHKGGYSFEW